MSVKDIMSRPVIVEDEEALVTKIAEDMEEFGIGSVVITKGGAPAGIITERDMALKVLLKIKRASEVKAREIMTSPLTTIAPEASVDEAWKLAARKRIKRLPVVENGVLVGIVSIHDIITRKPEYVLEFYAKMTVKDIMVRPVIVKDEEALVTKIAEDMEEFGIGSVVITKGGAPAGIITERDMALKVLLKIKRASEVKAREIMTSPLTTIAPEASVDEAWKLAARKRIKRLPVVEKGVLVGIVSIRDLLTRKPEYAREFYF